MGGSGSNPNPGKDQPSISASRPDDSKTQVPDIVIIEDSKTDVFLIREALKNANISANIHVLWDGYAATSFFDAVDADPNAACPVLVLLDMNLPKNNGAEVLRYMRASRRCKGARVLVVSSSDAPRDRASLEGLDAAGYFKKPSGYAEFMKLGSLVKALIE